MFSFLHLASQTGSPFNPLKGLRIGAALFAGFLQGVFDCPVSRSQSNSLAERIRHLLFFPDHPAYHYAEHGRPSSKNVQKSYLYLIQQVHSWIPNLHLSPEKQLTSWRRIADSPARVWLRCRTSTNLAMRAVSHHGSNRAAREVCVILNAPMKTPNWFAHALPFRFRGHDPRSSASPITTHRSLAQLQKLRAMLPGLRVTHGHRA